jgi:uncharacterized membrane protein YsdA (DUF1294 family)
MPHELRTATIAATTHLLLVTASSAVAVYALDQYDAEWGPGRTWQTLFWLAFATSALVFFGALFGAILASRRDRSLRFSYAVLAGVATAVLILILLALKRHFAFEGGLFGAVVGSMLVPFIVCVRMSSPVPITD